MNKFEEYQQIAARWCNQHYSDEDRQGSLRSEKLKPIIDIRDYNVSVADKMIEIDRINSIRKSILGLTKDNFQPVGRILKYYPDRSLGDALVSSETKELIAGDECPPWDTWFYFENEPNDNENILYCWVPVQIVKYLSSAMEADFYDCLVWHN